MTYMAEGKRNKVALQIVVASHGAVFGDDEKLLILGPAKSLYSSLAPLYVYASAACRIVCCMLWVGHTSMRRINLPAQLYTSMLALEA